MRTAPTHADPPRHALRWRRWVTAVSSLLAGLGLALIGHIAAASAAAWDGTSWAHAYGRYVTYTSGEVIWRGSEWIDGMQAYCLEPRWHSPDAGDSVTTSLWQPGTFYAEGDSNSGTVVSGAQAQAINWLVATHGQVADDQNALNIASAIRTYLHESNGNGDAPDTNLYRNAQAYLDLLRGYVAPATATTQPVGLAIATDPGDPSLGTLTITAVPIAGAPLTVTLSNGVFAANGATTMTLPTASAGLELPIQGVPPAHDGEPYRISAEALGNASVTTPAYPDTLLIATHDAVHQEMVLPQPPVTVGVALQGAVEDAEPRPSGFFPVVATEAVPAALGEPLQDTVTVAPGEDEHGTVVGWPRDADTGGYLPVVVDCTVYGPFEQPPARTPEVPADAPIATAFTVTTGDEGPDDHYAGVSESALAEPGYYSTVCAIDAARQPETSAVAAGYAFHDDFGQPAETVHVAPAPAPAIALAETGIQALPSVLLGGSFGVTGLLLALLGGQVARRSRILHREDGETRTRPPGSRR